MVGYGYLAGQAEIAFLRPGRDLSRAIGAKPREKRCLVMFGSSRSHPAYCVLGAGGAFFCPYSDVAGPRMTDVNATLNKNGILKLHIPLSGTHPARTLPWQRYPHVDGYIHPWTSSGRLRTGLRLRAWKQGHGPCYRRSEDIPDKAAITCLMPNLGRTGPCYPRTSNWKPGDTAACGGSGNLTFARWKITARG